MYIKVILSKYLKPNRWPKSGPLALNGVLLVAQKWPVGKQEVKVLIDEVFNQVSSDKRSNCCSHVKTVQEKYWSTDIAVENEIEKIVIYVDCCDSDTDTEDELETYDENTEDDEQNRADVYDCETEVDVRTDEDTLTTDTLIADTEDSCSGDATLTGEETLSAH